VLDGAQPTVRVRHLCGDIGLEMVGGFERGNGLERRPFSQLAFPAAVNELARLDEEFDLPDSATAPLHIVTGSELLAMGIMIADGLPHFPDFLDRSEIQGAAPDERLDRLEEMFAQCLVAGAGTGADEGCALPADRRGFVIGNGCVDRQRDRRDLRRRAKPKVDAGDVTVLRALLKQFDKSAADPDRCFPSVFSRPVREGLRIEQKQKVYVRREVELATSELAQRDDGEPTRSLSRNALSDRSVDGSIDRVISKIGELRSDSFKIELTRKIP